jgi:hypothetical protein
VRGGLELHAFTHVYVLVIGDDFVARFQEELIVGRNVGDSLDLQAGEDPAIRRELDSIYEEMDQFGMVLSDLLAGFALNTHDRNLQVCENPKQGASPRESRI